MTALSPATGTTDLSVQSIDDLAGEITLLSAHIQAATCRLLDARRPRGLRPLRDEAAGRLPRWTDEKDTEICTLRPAPTG